MKQNIDYSLMGKVLSKSATPSELKEFNDWLAMSEDNLNEYNETRQIWDSYNNLHANKEFDYKEGLHGVVKKVKANRESLQKRRKLTYWISSAAAVLILLGIFQLFSTSFNKDLVTYHATSEMQKLILDDGSNVWLNKNSTLKLSRNFNKQKRKVFLSGEGYFEITKNKTKPFEIISGKTTTCVLGTSFNVLNESSSNNVIVTVNSGKVSFKKINSIGNKVLMTKNEMAIYDAVSGRISKQSNANLNYLSWKNNELVFEKTPLNEVCSQLSKHYNKEVSLNFSDSTLFLNGVYKNESLDKILKTIEITFDVHVDSSMNTYLIRK